MTRFNSSLRSAALLLVLFTVLLGGIYPLLVFAIGQTAFTDKANGSLISKDGKIIGSALLGQEFTQAKYFWGRLSATTPAYNASASSGSNLSPANTRLVDAANIRIAALQKADTTIRDRIPVSLITASASGLDPHIPLKAAYYQADRVAKARKIKRETIEALIDGGAQHKVLGRYGERWVSVLELNLALDEISKP